ncbi:MAG TPA: SpvB/TcaC N-terminal domain-containing protein [Candidatus Limnocylindrales bacterium]|nr:SpvB/TcaC N-terminal domain-containing protein [Candidatus Limnocylindrales bacterium]
MPSGPGSIEGLGESFEPQLNSGTFVYRVPLKLPATRKNAAPSLALEYNSGCGNGMLGMGWRLPIPEIKRQTDRGLPGYDDTDTFIDWTGEELVRLADGTFRSENEGLFARFQRTNEQWLVTLPDGTRFFFGQTGQARSERAPGNTYCWKLELTEDLNGNRIAYRYTNHLGQLYPLQIEYGLHATQPSETFRVDFGYVDDRPDPVVDYRPRFRIETRLRLATVTVFLGDRRIRYWKLGYATNSEVSLLASVKMFGDERSRLDETALANRDFLPPTQFSYTPALESGQWQFFTNRLDVAAPFITRDAEFADLNRDGLPDLIYELNGEWFSALNAGGGRPFTASQPITNMTAGIHLNTSGTRLLDLTGDGGVKLMAQIPGEATYFFRDFISPTFLGPPVDFTFDSGDFPLDNTDIQFVDANGDKAMDVIRTFAEGPALLLNRSLGPQAGRVAGFYLPPDDPAMRDVQFSLGWQLADMNGDRLLDLVQFGTSTDGGTQVRLTRGLAEFEGQFAMAGGPGNADLGPRGSAAFHLVDVDQDGLSDLVQVESGLVRIWPNQGGRNWGAPISITEGIPSFSEGETTVRFLDLNGNGSTDIVWHQAGEMELVALDLHPASKPHQLQRVSTGMGRGLEITYKSSTGDMLASAGTTNAWTSLPPFPLQVIDAFEETDGLGGRYRSEFTYRNGYYDGLKKEFRGFETAGRRDVGADQEGAPTLITEYGFDTGAQNQVLKGKPLFVETRTEAGAVFQRETDQWRVRLLPLSTTNGEARVVQFAELRAVTNELREGLPAAEAVTLLKEFDYDDFGNQVRAADYGVVANGDLSALGDERVVLTKFAINTNAWILRHPKRSELQDEQGAVLSRSEFFYDDPTFSGNNFGLISIGNLTMKRDWTNALVEGGFIAASRAKYDAFGNPVTLLDPLCTTPGGVVDVSKGHVRELTYDAQVHTYPVTETIHVGGDSSPLVFQAAYDVGLSTVTRSTDFNTNSTDYVYDTFGRLTSIVKPGDTDAFPTAEYDYALAVPVNGSRVVNYIESRRLDRPPGTAAARRDHYFISRQFVDGLGRKLFTKTEAEPAEGASVPRVVVSDATLFNARQKPARVLNPFFSIQVGSLDDQLAFEDILAPGWRGQFHNDGNLVSLDLTSAHATRTDYDATLRPIRITRPDGTFSRTVYEPLRTRSFDENDTDPASPNFNTPMVHYNDGLGRLIQVDETARLNDDGTPAGDLRTWTTRYEYDLNDQLTRITDSQKNIKTFGYDGLKRKIEMNDPDRGRMVFSYDDASNLIETTDAKGQRITYSYDGVNRIRTEKYQDDQPLPPWRFGGSLGEKGQGEGATNSVVYHYDTAFLNLPQGDNTLATASNTKGQLAWAEDLSGEEHTSYDARGRVQSVVKRIPDPLFLSTASTRASALVSYKTRFSYDSIDRITKLIYPDLDEINYEYNERSLLRRIPGGPSGSIISNIVYQPSTQNGRIDYGNGVRTTYDYDARLRLKTLLTVAHPESSNQELIHFAYNFDGVSNIRIIEDRRPGADVPAGDPRRNTQLFQYDDLYRLKQARYSFELPGQAKRNDGEINYRYDRIGNMLAQTSTLTNHLEKGLPVADLGEMDSGGTAGRWNRLGRGAADDPGPHALSAVRNEHFGVRNYSYDANGNMLNIDGLTNTWDFKDRLVAVENNDMRGEYTYDYTDRRIMKRVWSKTTNSVPSAIYPLPSSVLYINKHFEVREHDAPTKYVWNGETRVAHVTGSLSSNQRVQRLRIWPGWNLCSLAVSGTLPLDKPTDWLTGVCKWGSGLQAWEPLTLGAGLSAGTVMWLAAKTNGFIVVAGDYKEPKDMTSTSSVNFLPAAGLEVWHIVSSALVGQTASTWLYDASGGDWRTYVPGAPAAEEGRFESIRPGEVVMVRLDKPTKMTLPPPALRIHYYHEDHTGSSSAIADADGNLAEETSNFPFGCPRKCSLFAGSHEGYQFGQKELEDSTGLLYYEARYLNPSLARFCSLDPLVSQLPMTWLEHPQQLNLYDYADNAPTAKTDSSGASSEAVATKFAGTPYDTEHVTDSHWKINKDDQIVNQAGKTEGAKIVCSPYANALVTKFLGLPMEFKNEKGKTSEYVKRGGMRGEDMADSFETEAGKLNFKKLFSATGSKAAEFFGRLDGKKSTSIMLFLNIRNKEGLGSHVAVGYWDSKENSWMITHADKIAEEVHSERPDEFFRTRKGRQVDVYFAKEGNAEPTATQNGESQ